MAYKNLVSQSCADKKEFFCRMRDFLCKRNGTYDYSSTGIGWTLFDSSYAVDEDNPAIGDWFVIYSPGEDGNQDLFFLVTWISGFLKTQGYLSWNPSTHAGSTIVYNTQNNFTLAESGSYTIFVYGDLDSIVVINKSGVGTYHCTTFGKLSVCYDHQTGEVATCSSALSSGSDVSITVDTVPSNWKVGRDIFIRTTHTNNTSTAKIEKTTIKTISGNTITCDLTNSYTANAKLSDFVGYFAQGNVGFGSTTYVLINNAGLANNVYASSVSSTSIPESDRDPDPLESAYGITEFLLSYATGGIFGKTKNFFSCGPGSLAFEDVLTVEEETYEIRYFKVFNNKSLFVKEV